MRDPSQEPAAAAAAGPAGATEVAAAGGPISDQLKKGWKGREFTVTLAKIASGDVKMTVWALSQQCRKEHHEETKERSVRENEVFLNSVEPGSWRCSRCQSVLGPAVDRCPNYYKDGNVPRPCNGSQADTWGGYVRPDEIRPLLSQRDRNPNWRGRFSGGPRSLRAKAKLELAEAEIKG